MTTHALEIQRGQRFEFGKNWQRFLSVLNDQRIAEAEKSLRAMLETESLSGKSFLDIGSGSGLFSLAAMRLGAARVHSFDYDLGCVECTRELKRRYFPDAGNWSIERGSVLEPPYLAGLGQFDFVYCWGVLHYCGNMWQGMENIVPLVACKGKLFIAIFNDQGLVSELWLKIKSTYNRLPNGLKFLVLWPAFVRLWGPTMIRDLVLGRPFRTWRTYGERRGMSAWHDVVGWVGGYPCEVAKPEEILGFYKKRSFNLLKLKTCGGGHGCNEFLLMNCAE
jgi:2-polyprenyl-6-hydroxyphenyl methylase/3-demethylubiquinone-9 3-methyltransferase